MEREMLGLILSQKEAFTGKLDPNAVFIVFVIVMFFFASSIVAFLIKNK